MKKVKFLINNLSAGGAERAVSNISLNLNSDIKRDIVLFGENATVGYPYNAKLSYLDQFEEKNVFKKIYNFIFRIKKLSVIKKNSDSTTISFLLYANLLNALLSKKGKTIISVRNHMTRQYESGNMSKIWKYVIRYIYPRADLITVVSQEIKKDLIEKFNIEERKIKVIYNSYDIEKIQLESKGILEEKYKKIFEKPVLIAVGRLSKQKGFHHLIRSFSKIVQKNSNVNLVILGDGVLKEKLEELVENYNLSNSVFFLGFQENPYKFISKSQIYVMPSLFEGFPNSLCEAMACGVPIVSSDCLSGPREILAPLEVNEKNIDYEKSENRFGVLLPVCDGNNFSSVSLLSKEEEVMANKILELLADKNAREYLSRKSLTRINDFSIKSIIKEWEKII